jgi:hypothetical protein
MHSKCFTVFSGSRPHLFATNEIKRLLNGELRQKLRKVPIAKVDAGRMRVDVLQVFGQIHFPGSGWHTWEHRSGLRKENQQDRSRTGSCRVRLSSKRDSPAAGRGFTSHKTPTPGPRHITCVYVPVPNHRKDDWGGGISLTKIQFKAGSP